AAERQQQQGQQQSGTVYDDVIRSMMARQPPQGLPPAPAGMTPVASTQPTGTMGGPPPPGNFRAPVQMAEGGEYDDRVDDTGDDTGDEPRVEAQGSASRATGPFDDYIQDSARRWKVRPALVRAIIQTESSGRPGVSGPATPSGQRATGLMQLMPGTARQ